MAGAHREGARRTVFSHPDFPEMSLQKSRKSPTVGSGIGPDLLTFRTGSGSARGLVSETLAGLVHLPPVGNRTPP